MRQHILYPPGSYKQFVPQRSSLHRQAVFALYRAIISQCTSVSLDDADKSALKNIARNRFQANRDLRSPRRLKLSFYAGYKALDYLDGAAAGEVASTQRLAGYLAKVPEHLKQPPPVKIPPPKRDEFPYETPPEHQFLNVFPRLTVKGERKVPHLVRANNFPFVRWKKPQPLKLSRVLMQLNATKQKNIDYQTDYEEYYIPLANNEDVWDELVQKQMRKSVRREESWSQVAQAGLWKIRRVSLERHKRTLEKARVMIEVVDKEQELADKEKAERKQAKQEKPLSDARKKALGDAQESTAW